MKTGFFTTLGGKALAVLTVVSVAIAIALQWVIFNNTIQDGKAKTQEAVIKLEMAGVADRRQKAETQKTIAEARAAKAVAAVAGLRQLSESELKQQELNAATEQANNAQRLKAAEAKLKEAESIIATNTAKWAELKACGDTAEIVWQQRGIEAKAFIQDFANRAVQR